jgi:4a-hydroxytetrahydrobiopterin dehydratase
MTTTLHLKQCHAVPQGSAPLASHEIAQLLTAIPGWATTAEATTLWRLFHFNNYYETIAFVNALAWIANQEDHHPELEVSYNQCKVYFNTHTVKGLSENDFICAAKVNQLLPHV